MAPPAFVGLTVANKDAKATDRFAKVAFAGTRGAPLIANTPHSTSFMHVPEGFAGTFEFPRLSLTEYNTFDGENYPADYLFGVRHARSTDPKESLFYKRADYQDLLRPLPASFDVHSTDDNYTETSFIFTLNDMRRDDSDGTYYYESGSQAAGKSISHNSGSLVVVEEDSAGVGGIKNFVMPMFGGFDGLDITEPDPFSHINVLGSNTEASHYAMYSIGKAIDIAGNQEQIRYDIISMPGQVNKILNRKLINIIEERQDALAIIDIEDGYKERFENNGALDTAAPTGSTLTIISNAKSLQYDTSYAATYHPRVRYRDPRTNSSVIMPPSVAGIGAIAQSERKSPNQSPWFAPAGFNRGGLEELGFQNAFKILTKQQRDDLYTLNINPIARFGAIGRTVVFGQKTLQRTKSALDRINVRRLMIFLKKRIGDVANDILFDQSVRATFNRFDSRASLILNSAKANFGVTEFKIVLDETTTTPDLVDRNILYAKIFIKPARAIEFIAIDFIITRTGIEF